MTIRRLTLFAVVATLFTMAAPSSALADHDMCGWANPTCSNGLAATMVSANPSYQGWGTTYCDFRTTKVGAYAWSQTAGWQSRSLACSTQVYIWPYASGWSWAWTSSTGWLAVRGDSLQWRSYSR